MQKWQQTRNKVTRTAKVIAQQGAHGHMPRMPLGGKSDVRLWAHPCFSFGHCKYIAFFIKSSSGTFFRKVPSHGHYVTTMWRHRCHPRNHIGWARRPYFSMHIQECRPCFGVLQSCTAANCNECFKRCSRVSCTQVSHWCKMTEAVDAYT